MAECKFCKMQYVGQTKLNFLSDEITTAQPGKNLMMTMNELPSLKHFYKFNFEVLNAKHDITECFIVLFVEQEKKTFTN